MFIRFHSGDIDEQSHIATGLFCAATELHENARIPDYEFEALTGLLKWFDENMASPFDYLQCESRYDRAVCWFKSDAHEHLAQAWQLVAILERNDILIWTIKSPRIGFVHYEDEVQVLAQPDRHTRVLLNRR